MATVHFGTVPRKTIVGATFPEPTADFRIDSGQWKALIDGGFADLSENFNPAFLLNQNPAEWCWIYSATQAIMVSMAARGGGINNLLLPDAVPVADHISPDQGEAIEDGLDLINRLGLPLLSAVNIPGVDPRQPNARLVDGQLPTGIANIITQVKIVDLPAKEDLVSAILKGMPVVAGVFWDGVFNQAHALCCLAVEHDDIADNITTADYSKIFICGPNSWGTPLPPSTRNYNYPDQTPETGKPGWFRIPLSDWSVGPDAVNPPGALSNPIGAYCIVGTNFDDQHLPAPPASGT
jgi:hypothetical protein